MFLISALIAIGTTLLTAEVPGVISLETGGAPTAYLRLSDTDKAPRALLFAMQNMCEETLLTMPSFLKRMDDLGVATMWIAPPYGWEWDASQGVQESFFGTLKALDKQLPADKGWSLDKVPLIPFGHSAQATMPWNFAAWNAEQTLCLISFHGDAPRTNLCGYGRANIEWGRARNIDHIPALMVMGEYEWWEDRLLPALAFQMMYPQCCISFLGDAGRGHFDLSERTAEYLSAFIEKALTARLRPNGTLAPVNRRDGWLAQRWNPAQTARAQAAPYADYRGDPHDAFWYFDAELAQEAERRYAETRGKKPRFVGFQQDGALLPYNPSGHCKVTAQYRPVAGSDTFHLRAVEVDSTRTKILSTRTWHIQYVCGPVTVVNDTTFAVDRTHRAWGNPRRGGDCYLVAVIPADDTHKEAVQELNLRVINKQQGARNKKH